MKKVLKQYQEVLENYPQYITSKDEINATKGYSDLDLKSIGLSTKDLKKLERLGKIIRAYTQNIFSPKQENTKAWAEVPVVYYDVYQDSRKYVRRVKRVEMELRPKYWLRGKGTQRRWILLKAEV